MYVLPMAVRVLLRCPNLYAFVVTLLPSPGLKLKSSGSAEATAMGLQYHQMGDTTLHLASRNLKVKCVDKLLQLGADGKATNSEGKSPLEVCGYTWTYSLLYRPQSSLYSFLYR
jgi:hypothetical protein